jgi:hypothetical protein
MNIQNKINKIKEAKKRRSNCTNTLHKLSQGQIR